MKVLAFTLLAAALLLTPVAAQAQFVDVNVNSVQGLITAFANADKNPDNYYYVHLARKVDSQGRVVPYLLNSKLLLKRGHVYVLGSENTQNPERYVIDGQGRTQLLQVLGDAGFSPSLGFLGVTLRNGYIADGRGGAIEMRNGEALTLDYCVLSNNKANLNGSALFLENVGWSAIYHTVVNGNLNLQVPACGGGVTSGGGGLSLWGSNQMYITNSTFSGNTACRGGGMEIRGSSNVEILNSTFSGNVALKRGGGLFLSGGTGTVNIRFSTIAYNKAGTTSPARSENNYGGGLALAGVSGLVNIEGTVIAKNEVPIHQKFQFGFTTNDCYTESGTGPSNYHGNIMGERANCPFGFFGSFGICWDEQPFDPKLNAILISSATNDGFALPVHKPLSDSPVRQNFVVPPGSHLSCDGQDQLSHTRPNFLSGRCDIGSVESGAQ